MNMGCELKLCRHVKKKMHSNAIVIRNSYLPNQSGHNHDPRVLKVDIKCKMGNFDEKRIRKENLFAKLKAELRKSFD